MTKRNAALNVVVILALLFVSAFSAACSKGSGPQLTNPSPTVTPTAPVITGIEFRIAPTGLGSPLGPLVTGPVDAGTNIQIIVNATVNTDRVVTKVLKVYDPAGNLVVDFHPDPSNAQAAFPAGMGGEFLAKKSGVYKPMAMITDTYGADMKESPTLTVK